MPEEESVLPKKSSIPDNSARKLHISNRRDATTGGRGGIISSMSRKGNQ
jgi:hypothetical protein